MIQTMVRNQRSGVKENINKSETTSNTQLSLCHMLIKHKMGRNLNKWLISVSIKRKQIFIISFSAVNFSESIIGINYNL